MTREDNGLTRVTVNLTPRAVADMDAMIEKTGLGKTDVINRALQVYALVERLMDTGGDGALTVVHDNGERERIYIL